MARKLKKFKRSVIVSTVQLSYVLTDTKTGTIIAVETATWETADVEHLKNMIELEAYESYGEGAEVKWVSQKELSVKTSMAEGYIGDLYAEKKVDYKEDDEI